jgi:hypothetical protein
MKTFLFEDNPNLKPSEIIDALEADNCGVEECHTFVKRFAEDQMIAAESEYLEKSKELNSLERELDAISSPIKVKMKPLRADAKVLIESINRGGEEVTEKVYCFPDYESHTMGLYDMRGYLIGTRPMKRAERQLHINSHQNKAV